MSATTYYRRTRRGLRYAVRGPAVLSTGQIATLAGSAPYTVECYFRQAAFVNPTAAYTGMTLRQLLVSGLNNGSQSWFVEARPGSSGTTNLFFYNVQAATATPGTGEHLITTLLPMQSRNALRVEYNPGTLALKIEVNNVVVLSLTLAAAMNPVNTFTFLHTPGQNNARAFYGDLEEPRVIVAILSQAVKDATWNQYNADLPNLTSYAGAWDFKTLAIGAGINYLDISGHGQSLTNTTGVDLRVVAGSNF